MSEFDSTAQLFDRHGAFVRRVARELCRDEADADDLAQDTWAEALRRPPARWSSPRGWLARVARRLAAKRGRGERRRTAREASVARAEAVDEHADRTFVLQELVAALVELDEDTRRLVVARHFEGLELAAIARREGLGVTTVKTRLRGAHARLRARLDARSDGDRRVWLAALAPFAAPPAPPAPPATSAHSSPPATSIPAAPRVVPRPLLPLAAGAALVGMKLQLALAGSVAALAALGILRWSGDDVEPPRLPETGVVTVAAADAELTNTVPRGSARAPVVAAAVADEVPAAAGFELSTLTIVVTDLDGIPAPDVEVFAAPPRVALNRVGATDDEGRLELRWRGPSDRRELVVSLRSNGAWLGGLRRLEVPAGTIRTLRIAADGALLPDLMSSTVRGVVLRMGAKAGNYRVSGKLTFDTVQFSDRAEEQRPERVRPGALLPDVREEVTGGLAFVAGGREEPGRERGEVVQLVSWGTVMMNEGATATVEGVVRDLTGRPAGGVRVSAWSEEEDAAGSSSTRTDSTGGFELAVPAGKLVVEVADPGLGGERLRLELAPEGRHAWEPYIDRGLTLFGEVHDGSGAAQAEAIVEATCTTPEGTWLGVARTDGEGRFELPRCPKPLLSLDVLRPGDRNALPCLSVGAVALAGEPWKLVIDGAPGAVSSVVRDESPESPLASEVRVWNAERRRGVSVSVRNGAGEPVTASVPVGSWFLSVGSSSSHWSEEVAVDVVASGEEVELGSISLGPTGWLALPDLAEGERWRVVRTGDDFAPREVFLGRVHAGQALPLPPGTYRVERRDAESAVLEEREVEVVVARETTM